MHAAHASYCTDVQAGSFLRPRDQVKKGDRSKARPAVRRNTTHKVVSNANKNSAFAATVSPDVAQERASSSSSTAHSSKALTQQSSGASHLKPFYPEKTINCNDEEWKARVDLAAIYRVCHNLGFNEGINNHLTAVVPGMPGHFLVFAFGLLWSEVTASNLLLMDHQGNVVRGEGHPEATAFWIHSRIHDVHPAAGCVVHTHQPHATALTLLEDPTLLQVHQNSMRFYNDIAYDREYNGIVLDDDEGRRIANIMQGKKVLLAANHGVIVATETIAEAFDHLYFLERAAEVQLKALAAGKPLKLIDEAICIETCEKFTKSGVAREYASLHLEAFKRRMRAGKDKDFCT